MIAARAFLETLKRHGVEHLFGNAGTDFAAVIEVYATHPCLGELPLPVTVPHENLAVAMAHGAYLVSGRPQAVMVHVNVGTANAVCGLVNAARERVPLVLCAGRNPVTETGSRASRNAFIHWGQEMFDQGAMVRELVKWDYEMRRPEQAAQVVDRAVTIAMAEPRGPVYLTLPRETLGEEAGNSAPPLSTRISVPKPDPDALEQARGWLSVAQRPVLITGGYGRDERERTALGRFAERNAVAVTAMRPRLMPMACEHPSFVGFEPGTLVTEADLILVANCDVPWIPLHHAPLEGTRVVHLGHDPSWSRYPLRGFPSDLAIDGDAVASLQTLTERAAAPSARQKWLEAKRSTFETLRGRTVTQTGTPTYAAVAKALAAVTRPGDVILSETAFPTELLALPEGVCYFGAPSSGGLGWGLGAGLGVKFANREKRVIVLVGDGAYMFGNPTPAHWVARANGLPFLTVILNNSMWAAVQRATLAVYPDSATKGVGNAVFTHLDPSPDYGKIVEASDGYSERVNEADELPAALARAFEAVEQEQRQAVLDVRVSA